MPKRKRSGMVRIEREQLKLKRREAESYVGRSFVLWNYAKEQEAIIDRTDMWRPANVVHMETLVTVIRVEFEGDRVAHGTLIATSAQGHAFENRSLKDGILRSGTWTCPDRKDWPQPHPTAYHDATELWGTHVDDLPFVTPSGERFAPNGVYICTRHGKAFMPDDPLGCWKCHLRRSTLAPGPPQTPFISDLLKRLPPT